MIKKIFLISHTIEAGHVAATPDPDIFFRTVMRDLPALDENAPIPSFQLLDPSKRGDGFFSISNQVLLFDKAIYLSDLGASLGFSGNVHSTILNDTKEEIFFLNVTAIYNCLNLAETVFKSPHGEEKGVDHGMGIKKLVFFPKLIGDSYIFRIPQRKSAIFVATDGSGTQEDFYTLYQASGIRGLSFDEVWSGE